MSHRSIVNFEWLFQSLDLIELFVCTLVSFLLNDLTHKLVVASLVAYAMTRAIVYVWRRVYHEVYRRYRFWANPSYD